MGGTMIRNIRIILTAALATLLLADMSRAHTSGVTELNEGPIRKLYVKKPLVGAKGYVVGHWAKGFVRVEVKNFPASETGYEVFLFKVDVWTFNNAIYESGNPPEATVQEPPPFKEVTDLFENWYSLGDLNVDGKGNGTLEYRKGDDLLVKGFNMMMVFEKKTGGRHEVPEDFGGLIVESNGALEASRESKRHILDVKVF